MESDASFKRRFDDICSELRVEVEEEEEEPQVIPAVLDSPNAAKVQYFPIRYSSGVGDSRLFNHAKYPYWTPPKVPSDRQNIHYWIQYLHKLPPEGVNAYSRLYEPIHRINSFVKRVIEESNFAQSGLNDVIQLIERQMWSWIRYAEREKHSIKYQLMYHEMESLNQSTIKTSIVPLTDWYLRQLEEERKLCPARYVRHMGLMEFQERIKTMLKDAHTAQFILTPNSTEPELYHKWPPTPPKTSQKCQICRSCFGYLERVGRSRVWEVVIHSHPLESSEIQ
ncbi:hypothetical protein AOQ84DRAFT_171055 [Glonium stellatum]|uniref:Uncharacterized protein n=1 Tax=Glonium stellatum TaxID=574774 RepID=A0A8E2FD35_9PEZI|nr:hypothetical protein AOQ84DRAFT_171055 [Glonium stellatum]